MAQKPQFQLPRDPALRLALGASLQRAARRNPEHRDQLNKAAKGLQMSADLMEDGLPVRAAQARQKPPQEPSEGQ